jgi:hypothetical protein
MSRNKLCQTPEWRNIWTNYCANVGPDIDTTIHNSDKKILQIT